MTSSLVGSEMCIRDRGFVWVMGGNGAKAAHARPDPHPHPGRGHAPPGGCLLYTSDAADDM
eukprot:9621788-Prorocentrum_lima.AAC.1